MHLSLFTTFCPPPNILVCPTNTFDKSTPVGIAKSFLVPQTQGQVSANGPNKAHPSQQNAAPTSCENRHWVAEVAEVLEGVLLVG